MPCSDGAREREWQEAEARRRDALAALLCGVMRLDVPAMTLATEWCEHHGVIDNLRKQVKYDWQDSRIADLKSKCDEVLDRAHQALCV